MVSRCRFLLYSGEKSFSPVNSFRNSYIFSYMNAVYHKIWGWHEVLRLFSAAFFTVCNSTIYEDNQKKEAEKEKQRKGEVESIKTIAVTATDQAKLENEESERAQIAAKKCSIA